MRLIKKPQLRKEKQHNSYTADEDSAANEDFTSKIPSDAQKRDIFSTIDANFAFIKSVLGNGIGLIDKTYMMRQSGIQIGLIYIDCLTDKKIMSSQIIEPLLKENSTLTPGQEDILEKIKTSVIFSPNASVTAQMEEVFTGLLDGSAILFVNETNRALIIESRILQNRPIEKPETEATMMGSLDSLTENIATNCYLINKRLQSPNLRFEKFSVGRLSKTEVKLLWIDGIARTSAVDDVRNRIQKIDIDALEGIGMLGELIRDRPSSIFPTFKQTQRPDVVSKNLTEGQFAVLCDNSPFAFIGPVSFWDHFKTMDDYAQDPVASSYLRIVRYISYVLCTTISPLYLAFVAFNHIVVPESLAQNIAKGRDAVPFPSFLEIILLTIMLTIIREASLRIPGTTGYFIGTMSAIVVGQASVSAGYVSASVIIVISVSVISSYAVSSSSLLYTTRIINYFLIILAGTFGMFGLINGVLLIIWHMTCIESFSLPYLYPVVPFDFNAIKDTITRMPLKKLNKRFGLYTSTNKTRM
jgi:spore germination protein KA